MSSRFLRQWALYEKKRGRLDEAATLFQRAMDVNAQVHLTLCMSWFDAPTFAVRSHLDDTIEA